MLLHLAFMWVLGVQIHILLFVWQVLYLITQIPSSLTPFHIIYFYITATITCFTLLVSRANTLLSIFPKRQLRHRKAEELIQGSTHPGSCELFFFTCPLSIGMEWTQVL